MARMSGGRALVESLISQEVETVFGIISIHTLHIYDALYQLQNMVRFIGAHHEQAAGHMADGYARATGRPGVFLTSSGPGAAVSVGAMGESYHASIPVLQVTTSIEREYANLGRGVTHEAKEQLRMFQSVSGWTAAVESVEDIPDQVHDIFQRFRSQHPRPAVLEIPTEVQSQEADVELTPPMQEALPAADPSLVEQAVERLLRARRPFILAGNGVMMAGATPELTQLAEALDCPVGFADGGKGAIPEDHPLCLGTALGRRIWGENPLQEWMATCDSVLVVGSSLPYRSTMGIQLPMPSELIQIDIDAGMLGRNYSPSLSLVGDARVVMGQMLQALGGRRVERDGAYKGELQELKHRIREGLRRQYPNPLRLAQGLREVLARDAIVVGDTTIAWSAMTRCFPAFAPRSFFGPHGWVGIGYGFSAAIGAKVGQPHRQVVSINGDGGFQCNLQELASCVQYDIAPVVLVFNDNAWGILKQRQHELFEDRFMATDLVNPDFVRLAEAYGIEGVRVSTQDQLLKEMDRSLGSARIQLIEVVIPQGFANFT